MRFATTQGEMLRCLDMVGRAVANRDVNPILTGIYLECENGRLTVRATDSEIGIEACTSVESDQPGKVVVEAKYFLPLVRRLPGGDVFVQELPEHQMLEIRAGTGSFRFQTMAADQFPALAAAEPKPLLRMPSQIAVRMIRQTVYAAQKDQGHSVFGGVLMEYADGELRFVATDTSRLCFNRAAVPNGENFKMILPARTCVELQRLLPSNPDSMLEIASLGSQVLFRLETEDVILVSRLLEGQYPDYTRVIPSQTDTEILASCSELISALERAELMGKKGPAIVTLSVEEGIMKLESRDVELGEANESLSIEQKGPSVTSAFQVRFLLDMLKTTDSDKVRMGLSSGLSPGMIRPVDDDDYIYVLMPVRVI
ncbi:MAG TPA: DNA polymerase III subunit beta [Firmicutes bacterium]|nr:DNA polymerase III subunit beta [Bacillota bacterium]